VKPCWTKGTVQPGLAAEIVGTGKERLSQELKAYRFLILHGPTKEAAEKSLHGEIPALSG
jgi:hypothetical protein